MSDYLDLLQEAVNKGMYPEFAGSPSQVLGLHEPSNAPESSYSGNELEDPNAGGQAATPPAATPVASPPGPPPVGGIPPGTSRSGGYNTSSSGFSPGKFAQVESTGDKSLDRGLAAADQAAESAAPRMIDTEKQSAAAQMAAAHGVASATTDKIIAEGNQARLMQGIQDDFAKAEADANIQSEAEGNKAKADYVAALADFRATKIDPAQLWHNMGGGQRFGTLVSVFVHDFLGVKGMQTSAMDTLNKAIDRNIEAQVQGLKTKGEVADGFKSLWYMQRSQASSDAEARLRVRGMLLEGAKQATIANISQYDAGLATAQGQAAIAAIDKEFAKNLQGIYQHIDNNKVQLRDQAVKVYTEKMKAAMESQSLGIRAMEANTNRMLANKQLAPAPLDYIINPESGVGELAFRPGINFSTEERAKVRTAVANTAEFNNAMNELRAFARKLPAQPDPIKGTRFNDEDNRQYEAIQYRLAHSAVKANDERATEQDVQQYLKSFPRDTWMTRGGVERILADMHQAKLDPAYQLVRQYTVDVPKDFQVNGPKNRPFAGSYADANLVASGHDQDKTHGQIQREEAEGELAGPASTKQLPEGDNAAVLDADHTFQAKFPQAASKLAEVRETGKVVGFERGAVELGQMAGHRGLDGKPTDDAIKAYHALKHEASSFLTNSPMMPNDEDWRGAFAYMMISDLNPADYPEPEKDKVHQDIYDGIVTPGK